ncbi:MAG: response regulator [Candidatus Eisenbacteria sp.]|nr:response regulator [Candidatus Eisenbacteria bacterium]
MTEPGTKGSYILLAEDETTNQYVFRAILESGNYEVTIVENGQLVLEVARKRRPDIILLDMMMPVMDGYKTAAELIKDDSYDGVPILALTAQAMKGDAEKTLQAGCDDYMSKPIRRQELLDKVSTWLSRDATDWMEERRRKRSQPMTDAA